MCVCACVCVCVYTHLYVYVYIYVCMYVYVITPLQVLYQIYKYLTLGPSALGLGTYKSNIAQAGVL